MDASRLHTTSSASSRSFRHAHTHQWFGNFPTPGGECALPRHDVILIFIVVCNVLSNDIVENSSGLRSIQLAIPHESMQIAEPSNQYMSTSFTHNECRSKKSDLLILRSLHLFLFADPGTNMKTDDQRSISLSTPSPRSLASFYYPSSVPEESPGRGVIHRREVEKKAREKQGKTFQRLVKLLGQHRTRGCIIKGRSNQLNAMLDLFE